MRIEELIPSPKNKVHFKLASFNLIPRNKAGCYLLSTFENEILYIGLSNNLCARFQQHLSNPGKTRPTKEGKAIWFHFEIYDRKNLPKLERTWLNQFENQHGRRPIMNRVDSPIS